MGQTLSEPVVEKVRRFEQKKQLGDEGLKTRSYPFGPMVEEGELTSHDIAI